MLVCVCVGDIGFTSYDYCARDTNTVRVSKCVRSRLYALHFQYRTMMSGDIETIIANILIDDLFSLRTQNRIKPNRTKPNRIELNLITGSERKNKTVNIGCACALSITNCTKLIETPCGTNHHCVCVCSVMIVF